MDGLPEEWKDEITLRRSDIRSKDNVLAGASGGQLARASQAVP